MRIKLQNHYSFACFVSIRYFTNIFEEILSNSKFKKGK